VERTVVTAILVARALPPSDAAALLPPSLPHRQVFEAAGSYKHDLGAGVLVDVNGWRALHAVDGALADRWAGAPSGRRHAEGPACLSALPRALENVAPVRSSAAPHAGCPPEAYGCAPSASWTRRVRPCRMPPSSTTRLTCG
jgi:hypothetical protein